MVHFRLRVRYPSGATVDVEVAPSDTVAQLKRLLEAAEGTPVDAQRLLCRGALMAEERTLGSYSLDGSTVIRAVHHLKVPAKTDTELLAPFSPKRGMLMVPGGTKWEPATSNRLAPDEHSSFFDSGMLPPAWEIRPSGPA